ncbi:hypothetical protein BMW23_0690 [Bodo saltans virus]|uniref:Uncharacterized protein n=1 Tax=Bodo saltans virus TaxID=2024608 RepID=A0A2H4UV55_9VIRU|nr:hypothetical protein QJ851_gp0673 [Bodo saltans virus]ATZ80736.1 hypothetical protein BMW23_0690 [Bodo saltans virus]
MSSDNSKLLIVDALEKYDKNIDKYREKLKDAHHYKLIINDSEIDYDSIIFYDKNEKVILEANFEIAGAYHNKESVWIWTWADPYYNKKMSTRSKNLLSYGLKLNNTQNVSLKMELTNSRFLITDPIQIDIHLALASELSKTPFIYKIIRPFTEEILIKEDLKNQEFVLKIIKESDLNSDNFKVLYFFLFNDK